eukprot:151704_1
MDDLRVEISLSRTLVYKLSTIVDLWMLDGKASNAFLCHVAWGSDIGEPFHQKLVPSTAQSFANQFNLDLSDECIKLIVDRIIIGGKYRMRNATRLDGKKVGSSAYKCVFPWQLAAVVRDANGESVFRCFPENQYIDPYIDLANAIGGDDKEAKKELLREWGIGFNDKPPSGGRG